MSARRSGVLLHPTSLPGPHGAGDLGAAAHRFVGWLGQAGQRVWQVLPLGPTGYGDSPYQCFSAFAGNPLLVSLTALRREGLLDAADLEGPAFPERAVDYGAVIPWKARRLRLAAERFAADNADRLRYDHRRGRWLIWDRHRWAPDESGGVTRTALETVRTWQRQALDIPPNSPA